jgi:methionyl-tRNA formyltransferase
MRIVVIGQAAFGAKVLEQLVTQGEQVIAVYTPPEKPGRTEPLKQMADKLHISSYQPVSFKSTDVYRQYTKLTPDLNVMAFVTSIIPINILKLPTLGTIQYHPSLLPKHRGGSAINWAIINGETYTGISIFWPDEGIDTGPLLLQKRAEISPDDTIGTLYFNKLFPLGIEAIIESIKLIKQGKAPKIAQIEEQASYEGLCTDNVAMIDWKQPAQTIYNLIRGTDPQPGAWTTYHGTKIKLYSARPLPSIVDGPPGKITDIVDGNLIVSLKDASLQIGQIKPEGCSKMTASEYVAQENLRIGAAFG